MKMPIDNRMFSLPDSVNAHLAALAAEWTSGGKVGRFWARDKTLWTNTDEDQWMGWLDIVEHQLEHRKRFESIAHDVKTRGFRDAALLGMGGSSLCPEVLAVTFGHQPGFPRLHILDATDPAQVSRIARLADPSEALFIVASKSGSTLEPNIFKQYFYQRAAHDGSRFIAITDPGSKMQAAAEAANFDRICFGMPSIGGRYSALSDFGMVPAAVLGIDTGKFLTHAQRMVEACREPDALKNPGISLGLALGALQQAGRDKMTIITSPAIHDLGAWLEQLVAESTGKLGKAIIPVDRESLAAPHAYGTDRVFVYVRYSPAPNPEQDAAVAAFAAAGQPVIRIELHDLYDLGAEFFRWEVATAVAGSVMGINPFNQPDVEAAKIATRELTNAYEASGALPAETPRFTSDGLRFFTDDRNAAQLSGRNAAEYLRSHLSRIEGGKDYVALLAYIDMTAGHEHALQSLRTAIRDHTGAATCLGFGPRFLHSTGQAYKGGPNTGVILQITCDDRQDVAIPGQKFSFGIVKQAQAAGDFAVLTERGRRALRVHLSTDVPAGLRTLESAIREALN